MPDLDPPQNPTTLPVSLATSPRTRALTEATEIRHSAAVPGSTDNDSNSWREHIAGVADTGKDNADLNRAAIDALRDLTQDVRVSARVWRRAVDGEGAFIANQGGGISNLSLAEGYWDNTDDPLKVTQHVIGGGLHGFVLIRLPDTADVNDYQLRITSGPTIYLSSWHHFGTSNGFSFHLVTFASSATSDTTITLSVHGVSYAWIGEVVRAKVLEALGMPPYDPWNRGYFLQRTADDFGFEFVRGSGLIFTARSGATSDIIMYPSDLRTFTWNDATDGDLSTTIDPDTTFAQGDSFGVGKEDSSDNTVSIVLGNTTLYTLRKQGAGVIFVFDGFFWHLVADVGPTQEIPELTKARVLSALNAAGLVDVVGDDDSLPDVAGYDDGQIVLHRGDLYHKGVSTGSISFSFRSAGRGALFGVSFGGGQWIVNPSARFNAFFDTGSDIELQVRRSEYRTAKGSNEAEGDVLVAAVVTDEDTPRSANISMTYSGTGTGTATDRYLLFTGSRTGSLLDAALNGHVVTVSLTRGGADFLRTPTPAHEAWVKYRSLPAQENASAITQLVDRLQHLAARITGQEESTVAIGYDDENLVWRAEPNTADGGKHPYGGWQWIRSGSSVASYGHKDYAIFAHAAGNPLHYSGAGLIWVLPNNVNWSRVRLVVYRADGAIRSIITGQSLRNAPDSLAVANLPGSPPDVTVRWSASSDTLPFAVSRLESTDQVVLQVLEAAHVPVWNGEYKAGSIGRAALATEVFTNDLPSAPAAGARTGRVPRFLGDDLVWGHPVRDGTVIARLTSVSNRSNLNAVRWSIPNANIFGGTNTVQATNETLKIFAHRASAGRSLGIFVEVMRSSVLQSRVFVPWSAFRTNDGDYVTGGTRQIAQGHYLGCWRLDATNSTIYGDLFFDHATGFFHFGIGGGNADANSGLTVYVAE